MGGAVAGVLEGGWVAARGLEVVQEIIRGRPARFGVGQQRSQEQRVRGRCRQPCEAKRRDLAELDRQVAQLLRSDKPRELELNLSQQLAQGWKRYFEWEVLIAAGFMLRPFGGIAKLGDTPSWILICTGISLASLIVLAYVTDIQNKQRWWRLIKPAGTITLTCYLLPDIHFAILKLLGESVRVPEFLRTGWVGVGKSLIFAFLIVLLTGVLEKKKIRLSV